mmetsp:Transcript_2029/g.4632  ORF Transcript_2029/g.4632 Transcript_2029/m.4632 type:complete len:230 (-) Transcript_2029:107-796(-)
MGRCWNDLLPLAFRQGRRARPSAAAACLSTAAASSGHCGRSSSSSSLPALLAPTLCRLHRSGQGPGSGVRLLQLQPCQLASTAAGLLLLKLLLVSKLHVALAQNWRLGWAQLLGRVGEAAIFAMLTSARLHEAAHLHLEKSVRRPELGLIVRERAHLVIAHANLHQRSAHAGPRQVRLPAHLVGIVGVGAPLPVVATTLLEELAHFRLEELQRVLSSHGSFGAISSHGT